MTEHEPARESLRQPSPDERKPEPLTYHPRYAEWRRMLEAERKANIDYPSDSSHYSFEAWLKANPEPPPPPPPPPPPREDKPKSRGRPQQESEPQESKSAGALPKIRDDNPPSVDIEYIRSTMHLMKWCKYAVSAFVALPFLTATLYFLDIAPKGLTALAAASAIFGSWGLIEFHNKQSASLTRSVNFSNLVLSDGEYFPRLFELDAYLIEFTAPLADRSTLLISVHFQIPRELDTSIPLSYGTPPPFSHLVKQLNRVIEVKLITYVQQFTEPPSRLAIEDHLKHELVRFQDENKVAVLRVEVPIAIHVDPEKPRGVNV